MRGKCLQCGERGYLDFRGLCAKCQSGLSLLLAETPDSRARGGRREDLDNRFFRSAWEANVARYLNFLMAQGQVHHWEYEADTFWFEKIKRGVRSYKPDFKIWDTADSEPYYWEVKGYDYPRGITARKRMAKYYPKVRLEVIDEDAYKALKKWKSLIPGWE